ncbi:hypothetical protein V6N13_129628 [Hibiscus sabdariffa]|uniref:Uncharacterized protein n=1 Tax=Hibiscus sabdariffa TaxID=183260 RepID=A0ABR2SLQ0_9ROSI
MGLVLGFVNFINLFMIRDGIPSPAKACAPSCGSGSCTGLSKMVLLYWVGDTLGRVMMIILLAMETSISDYWQCV